MLRYLGEVEAADRFDAAILKVLTDSNVLTGDLGGSATTMELASEVKNNL
jgi:Isocitrate/isopropylmalate dehydrogenase